LLTEEDSPLEELEIVLSVVIRQLVLCGRPGRMYRHALLETIAHHQLIGQFYSVRTHGMFFLPVNIACYDGLSPYQFPSVVVHTHSIMIIAYILRMIVRDPFLEMTL